MTTIEQEMRTEDDH